MFARVQRHSGRQILVSTHSYNLLQDEGIGLDEVLLLEPGAEGSLVHSADSIKDIRLMLEGGVSMADAVIPRTRPEKVHRMTFFGT